MNKLNVYYKQLNKKNIICLDFDGVIHRNLTKWQTPLIVNDASIEGVQDAIVKLRKDYLVYIHSGRCSYPGGVVAIQHWLDKHNIIIDKVCENKPLAYVYIDDRAICFKGNWVKTIDDIAQFKQWQHV